MNASLIGVIGSSSGTVTGGFKKADLLIFSHARKTGQMVDNKKIDCLELIQCKSGGLLCGRRVAGRGLATRRVDRLADRTIPPDWFCRDVAEY